MIDTFTMDHLLSKLSSSTNKVISCLSPINIVNLPYFERYLKKEHTEGKKLLLIPLCDSVHFQGYIVDIQNHHIVHVDSLASKSPKNTTSKKISEILFDTQDATYSSLFNERVQFDSNTCGMWLISGLCSYALGLPIPQNSQDAYEIAFNLFEEKENITTSDVTNAINSASNIPQHHDDTNINCNTASYNAYPNKAEVNPTMTNHNIDQYASAEFLIRVLTNEPTKSEHFREHFPKGIRSNFFFISMYSLADANTDDNGAYNHTRNTYKTYYYKDNKVNIVHHENGKFYHNVKESYKSYKKVYVSENDVVGLRRRYGTARSFPLKRIIVSLSYPVNGPELPYIAVLYQANAIKECITLPHGNAKKVGRPYIRTSPLVLEKAKDMISKGTSLKTVYDNLNEGAGGVFNSQSQSEELRDMNQIYRQKNTLKQDGECNQDELFQLIKLQREDPDFIRSVCCLAKSYYAVFCTDAQLNDMVKFCCINNSVLSIDTTFNLCKNWLTDTCYPNLRLATANGKHPVFLGPSLLHFEKSTFVFHRFIKELCSFNPSIKSLKVIGTDQEKAIFNGFSQEIENLKLLLCVFHLERTDKDKLKEFCKVSKDAKTILRDIYGCQYGSIREYGLADSINAKDFHDRLIILKPRWEKLSPGFFKWFYDKRSSTFENHVIESARTNTNIQELFYNNSIESQHFREKKEQSFKIGSLKEVKETLKRLVERQQDDEARAIYGSGPYTLSKEYSKFSIESTKWHSMTADRRRKHLEAFRNHEPTLEDGFSKPVKSGRKPCQRIRKRNVSPEITCDRLSKETKLSSESIRIQDPNAKKKVSFELHFRSLVPRKVEKCQGNCGEKLVTADLSDYLLVRSYGPSTFMVKGESMTKYGPQYVHFNAQCLKEYAHRKHDIYYENFPLSIVSVTDTTLGKLSQHEKEFLTGLGVL